jgi:hypothetical protein
MNRDRNSKRQHTWKRIVMSDDSPFDDCDSYEIKDRSVPEASDDALEAAASGINVAFSLSSTGIVAPNCC